MRPDRTAAQWATLAVRAQLHLDAAARIFGWGSRAYWRRLHLRNGAGGVAKALGSDPWPSVTAASRVEFRAQFHHLYDGALQ